MRFLSLLADYVKLLKYGDSLYRCKQLKRAALARAHRLPLLKPAMPSRSSFVMRFCSSRRCPQMHAYGRCCCAAVLGTLPSSSWLLLVPASGRVRSAVLTLLRTPISRPPSLQGRMCTLMKKQSASLAYLEQVRQHMVRFRQRCTCAPRPLRFIPGRPESPNARGLCGALSCAAFLPSPPGTLSHAPAPLPARPPPPPPLRPASPPSTLRRARSSSAATRTWASRPS